MISTLFLAAWALAAEPTPGAPSDVVARAGDFALTREMLDAYWNSLPPGRQAGYQAAGGKRAFVEEILDTKLVVAEAQRIGLASKPALQAELDIARDTILYRAYLDQEVTRKIVTEEAMRKFYDENQARFKVETHVRARQIVATPHAEKVKHNEAGDDATSEAEAEAKVRRLLAELKAGADFATLARKYSEDPTARNGGLLEDFARGKMAKPIEDVAFSLPPGKVSEVIRSPYGFHLLKVEEVLPEHIRPFAEVRDPVARAVAEERKDSFQPRFELIRERLRKAAPFEIDDRALPKLVAKPSATPGATPGAKPAAAPAAGPPR